MLKSSEVVFKLNSNFKVGCLVRFPGNIQLIKRPKQKKNKCNYPIKLNKFKHDFGQDKYCFETLQAKDTTNVSSIDPRPNGRTSGHC